MIRQSITISVENDMWLEKQIEKGEFTSKSEAINYLIRHARKQEAYHEYVLMKIELAEKSGLAKNQTKEDLLAEFKKRLNV